MNLQPPHPEHEQQPDQGGEEPEQESLIDAPDFYRGGSSLVVGSPGDFAEPYLVKNRARAVGAWVRGDVSYKSLGVFLGVVGGTLIIAMLLLT